jgi:hypothetical protein
MAGLALFLWVISSERTTKDPEKIYKTQDSKLVTKNSKLKTQKQERNHVGFTH